MIAQPGGGITSSDVTISSGLVYHLHDHPLTLVQKESIPTFTIDRIFGLSGSYVCASCVRVTYKEAYICTSCKFYVCGKCFMRHKVQQEELLDTIIDERHGAGNALIRHQKERNQRVEEKEKEKEVLPSFEGGKFRGDTQSVPTTASNMLFSYCLRGDLNSMKEVIDRSSLSNPIDLESPCLFPPHEGCTVLAMAAKLGSHSIVELLLSRGSNKEALDSRGMTPLMHASHCGHAEIADELIFAGCEIDKVAHCGYTALLFAANMGHALCVDRLVVNGAMSMVQTPRGRTPLIVAALNGHTHTVSCLLAAMSRSNILLVADEEGYTALTAAKARKHVDIVHLIQQAARVETALSAV